MKSIPLTIVTEELNKIPLGRLICDQCGEWDHDCRCQPNVVERTRIEIVEGLRSHIQEQKDDPMKDVRAKLNILGENLFDKEFLESCGIERTDCGDFIILNYSQISKPTPLNKLCRGTVFSRDGKLASLPFIRFFNLHEKGADNVDWRYCKALEKMDGTLVNIWSYNRVWHISTRRMIDKLEMSRFGGGDPFNMMDFVNGYFPHYGWTLDPTYWYVFEAVTPYNRIVTNYPENKYGMYLLAMRHNLSLKECGWAKMVKSHRNFKGDRVFLPTVWDFSEHGQVLKMFDDKPSDFEGVVIVDKEQKRVKIKQKSYVHLHHIISNISSRRNMIDLILGGEEAEVLSYFPELQEQFGNLRKDMNELKVKISTEFGLHNHLDTQKDFALAVKDLPYSYFLFRMRKGDDLKFIFNQMTGKKLERYVYGDK